MLALERVVDPRCKYQTYLLNSIFIYNWNYFLNYLIIKKLISTDTLTLNCMWWQLAATSSFCLTIHIKYVEKWSLLKFFFFKLIQTLKKKSSIGPISLLPRTEQCCLGDCQMLSSFLILIFCCCYCCCCYMVNSYFFCYRHSCAGHEISLFFSMRSFYLSIYEKQALPIVTWSRPNNSTHGITRAVVDKTRGGPMPAEVRAFYAQTLDNVRFASFFLFSWFPNIYLFFSIRYLFI